jgi:RNA polymerase sigma factor (sigma-70 family)
VPIDSLEDKTDDAQNIEDHVLEREYLKTFIKHLDSMLDADEKMVFNMYAQGYSYKEIGERIKTSPKKVDNILQKIKRKLRGL